MHTLRLLALILALTLGMVSVRAQASDVPLAVEVDGNLYVLNSWPASAETLAQSLTLISSGPSANYGAVWSPDGTLLAYAISAANTSVNDTLFVWDGTQAIELVTGFFGYEIPLSWTTDGRIVYTLTSTNPDSGAPITQIYTIAPETGAQPQLVRDRVPLNEACSISMLVPMISAQWNEAGIQEYAPVLAFTAAGMVYGTACSGGAVGLYRPDASEPLVFAAGQLTRVAVAPDGTRLAGIVSDGPNTGDGRVVVVDLLTLAETTLSTVGPVSRVVWGADGSLYYTVEVRTGTVLDSFTSEQVAEIGTLLGTNDPENSLFHRNVIQLYRRAPDGTETLLQEVDAYGVGRLALHGDVLVFSTSPNGEAWLQAVLDGSLDQSNRFFGAAAAYVPITVHYLQLNADGTVGESGTLPGNLQRVAVPR